MSLGSILNQNYQKTKLAIEEREKIWADENTKYFRQVLEDKFPAIREQLIRGSLTPGINTSGFEYARRSMLVSISFDNIKIESKDTKKQIELASQTIIDFFKSHEVNASPFVGGPSPMYVFSTTISWA